MITEKEQKRIFTECLRTLSFNDKGDELVVWDELVNELTDFQGGEIIREKVTKVVETTNELYNTSEEKFNEFLEKDVEEDIWESL